MPRNRHFSMSIANEWFSSPNIYQFSQQLQQLLHLLLNIKVGKGQLLKNDSFLVIFFGPDTLSVFLIRNDILNNSQQIQDVQNFLKLNLESIND